MGIIQVFKCKFGLHEYPQLDSTLLNEKLKTFCLIKQECVYCKKTNINKEPHHNWTKWKYKNPNDCTLERSCRKCQRKEEQFNHIWGDWEYKNSNSCIQIRVCKQCHTKDSLERETHNWDDWIYENADSCKQIRICKHCGLKEKNGKENHNWGLWEYQKENSCIMIRSCKHCNTKDKDEREIHNWGEWEYQEENSCTMIRRCKRCQKTDNESIFKHDWGEWEFHSAHPCLQLKICKKCDVKEQRYVHEWSEWHENLEALWKEKVCTRCGMQGEKIPIDPWVKKKAAEQRLSPLEKFQKQIIEMLDENKSRYTIEQLVRKEFKISRDEKIGFCKCGFPVWIIYGDGSRGPIHDLVKKGGYMYRDDYFCPKCDELFYSWES